MNKKEFLEKMTNKRWFGLDLTSMEVNHLKTFCNKNNIKYDIDDSGSLIHVEIYGNLLEETNVKSFLIGFNACADEFCRLPF